MRLFLSAAVTCFALFPVGAIAGEVEDWTHEHLPEVVKLYVELHQAPELSFQEERTAARLAEEWRSLGFKVTTGVGGHGVVALMHNGDGPTVMLRCDMDALPVAEQTGLPYASEVTSVTESGRKTGVMHACGHDIHMANMVGVTRFLASHKNLWSGTLMVIAQPAEEMGAGAKAMLEDQLFERFPRPDRAFAIHVASYLEAGHVNLRGGFGKANVDSVDITMFGRGGHGSAPHKTVDPVVLGAEVVVALQTIVSREIDPLEPAVVTVGSIHGGTKHNIIGDDCHLELTVRSYSEKVREHLLEAIERKAKAVAAGAKAPEPKVVIKRGTPSLFNDEDLTVRVTEVLKETLGDEKVHEAQKSMGGEDFSRYGKAGVPIVMFGLGTVTKRRMEVFDKTGQSPPSLHSAQFYPDPRETLQTGIISMANIVLDQMKKE
ncbi:amidohydrolase [Calycomorphotria hydatis]|uniref:N-acetyldiaminopimelate deacetylase n=1 Tax=Calycomorphotria hydatis TaxID=2528027 RepID=A0A517TDP2_9PLAN|nr:amidohydrolase [Calycomorphotria hydatis]QDT66494.1 N-acetyldiaminopimelate deacetylase [Calycomorphotria hydatis]